MVANAARSVDQGRPSPGPAPPTRPPRAPGHPEPLLEQFADEKKRSLLAEDLKGSERMLREVGRIDPSHRLRFPPDVVWMVRVIGVIGALGQEKVRREARGKGTAKTSKAAGKPFRLKDAHATLWTKDGSLDHRRVVDEAARLLEGVDQQQPEPRGPRHEPPRPAPGSTRCRSTGRRV